MLSFNTIIQCYHSMLSFNTIIQCYHSMLSFNAIIQYYHSILSFNAIIQCSHSILSFNAIISKMISNTQHEYFVVIKFDRFFSSEPTFRRRAPAAFVPSAAVSPRKFHLKNKQESAQITFWRRKYNFLNFSTPCI